MSSPNDLGAAALLGAACGMRTFAGPAALAARGRIGGVPGALVIAGAALEVVIDKAPATPARIAVPGLVGRLTSGALSGRALAGTPGAGVGAAAALAVAYGGYYARKMLGKASGVPDPLLGAAEDGVAATTAALATRDLG